MYMGQEGRCGCCGTHQSEQKRSMAVDHCHETGDVRGLLCGSCNLALGKLGDNLDGVLNLVNYLEGGDHV